jgi:hypothetical protein
MHYDAMDWSRSESEPVLSPINCSPNCPKILGQDDGLSYLDVRKLFTMYQCKAHQYRRWTHTYKCHDWPTYKKRKLNCARYIKAGKCKRDERPCCDCDGDYSGYFGKKYIGPSSTQNCRDENEFFCSFLATLKGYFCFSGYVKSMCERTCSVCT